MKQLANKYKFLLKKIAIKIQNELKEINDDRIIATENIELKETNTYGWHAEIFGFKGIAGRGKIEIWLDLFTNIGRPTLAICFWNSDIKKVTQIANSYGKEFYDDHNTEALFYTNGSVLVKPLQRKYFEEYLIEPYELKYLTCYFHEKITGDNMISSSFLKKIVNKTEWLLRTTVSVLEIELNNDMDYPSIENRIIVSIHKRRDRSKALATKAKRRDGFKCRVCDFHFVDKYGHLGRGVAEAHHIISLSSLKKEVQTNLNDLITVCANCHRILHKMKGEKDDYKVLQTIVRKNISNNIQCKLLKS